MASACGWNKARGILQQKHHLKLKTLSRVGTRRKEDVCLILTRQIGKRVDIRLPRKHRSDTALRFRETCDDLANSYELRSGFDIPNAAGDLEVAVNLQRRTISCSMRLQAPADRKRSKSRINWLLRQLPDTRTGDIFIRAYWSGRNPSTQGGTVKGSSRPHMS